MKSSAQSGDGSSSSSAKPSKTRVKVVIRIRPQNREDAENLLPEEQQPCVEVGPSPSEIMLSRPFYAPKRFGYDCVLPPSCSQEDAYEAVAGDIVRDTLEGFNATVMCYGQTGAGKTYTVFGKSSKAAAAGGGTDDPLSSPSLVHANSGIVARVTKDLFDCARQAAQETNSQVRIEVAMIQVYMETIQDLLSDTPYKNLGLREDPQSGVFIEGLRKVRVASPEEVAQVLKVGAGSRITALTRQNGSSSRSHLLLRFHVIRKERANEAGGASSSSSSSSSSSGRVRLKRR